MKRNLLAAGESTDKHYQRLNTHCVRKNPTEGEHWLQENYNQWKGENAKNVLYFQVEKDDEKSPEKESMNS